MKQRIILSMVAMMLFLEIQAQDSAITNTAPRKDKRPVKDAFESNWLITSQSMIVTQEKTLEFDINHRFGIVDNGFKDMLGLYAPSNIRLGLTYTPIKDLQLGAGITKEDMIYDFNLKYSILKQTRSGSSPVFITYFSNMALNKTENGVLFKNPDGSDYKKFPKYTNRFSYFHQIIIGRKFNDRISLQVSSSLSHYNLIDTATYNDMKSNTFAVGLAGRVKMTSSVSAIFEYTQSMTPAKDVKPNLSIGIEASTGSHAFQVFLSPFTSIMNQKDVVFNKNDYTKGHMAIGFNITRLWNF